MCKKLFAEDMGLQALRKALKLTQVNLAKKLSIGQEGVSRLEQHSDLMLSTLRNHIEAMGEKLKITAEFPYHTRSTYPDFPTPQNTASHLP